MMSGKDFEILFKAKLDGQQETLAQFQQLSQQLAETFSKAFDQAINSVQTKLQTILLTDRYGNVTGSHQVGGGGGAQVPGSTAAFTTAPPPPMNAFSGLGSMAFPGGVYAAAMGGNSPFTQMGAAMSARAGSPYYGPNMDADLAVSEARAINAARKAGVNVNLTDEGRSNLLSQRETAKEAIEAALVTLKELNTTIKESARSTMNLEREIADLRRKAADGDGSAKALLAEKETQARQAAELMSRRDSLQSQISTGARGIGEIDTALGAGGRGGGALGALGRFAGYAGMVGMGDQIITSMQSGYGGIANQPLNDTLNGNLQMLMYQQRAGGRGASVWDSLLGGVGALNPFGGNFLNPFGAIQSDMAAKAEADRAMNPFLYAGMDAGRSEALGNFDTAMNLGGSGLYNFLGRGGNGLYGRGAVGGVGAGAIRGMLTTLAGTARGDVNRASGAATGTLVDLLTQGDANAGGQAAALYQGGMDLDRSASKLRELFTDAFSAGIDKSKIPVVLDRVAATAAGSYGGAEYATDQARFMMNQVQRINPNASMPELEMYSTAQRSLDEGTRLGSGSMPMELAGMRATRGLNEQIYRMTGKRLGSSDLMALQAMRRSSPQELQQFLSDSGISISGEQASTLSSSYRAGTAQAVDGVSRMYPGRLGQYARGVMLGLGDSYTGVRAANQYLGAAAENKELFGPEAPLVGTADARDGVGGGQLAAGIAQMTAALTSSGMSRLPDAITALNGNIEKLITAIQSPDGGAPGGIMKYFRTNRNANPLLDGSDVEAWSATPPFGGGE